MVADRKQLKTLLAGSIENALEWYDFGLYGFFASTLQKIFFPFETSEKGLLAVFSVFAVGFFMRPIGGILFGFLGDTHGRKTALIFSLIAMATATVLFAMLPTYDQAGIWAIIFFILLRQVQGLAVGGEMMGSLTFLAEQSSKESRGLNTSLIYSLGTMGGVLATLVGTLLFLFFSEKAILSWAWRLPLPSKNKSQKHLLENLSKNI